MALAEEQYSTFVLGLDIEVCVLEHKVLGLTPKYNTTPKVDLLQSKSNPQSTLTEPYNTRWKEGLKTNPCVPFI